MTRRWWWPWGSEPDTAAEAAFELARVEQRDDEVQQLADELRTAQRRNHFSEMVAVAISRAQAGGA